jgi:hypothetical protein
MVDNFERFSTTNATWAGGTGDLHSESTCKTDNRLSSKSTFYDDENPSAANLVAMETWSEDSFEGGLNAAKYVATYSSYNNFNYQEQQQQQQPATATSVSPRSENHTHCTISKEQSSLCTQKSMRKEYTRVVRSSIQSTVSCIGVGVIQPCLFFVGVGVHCSCFGLL